MSDPAIEAAQRAFKEHWPEQGEFEFNFGDRYGQDCAREALAPLRELHKPDAHGCTDGCCTTCECCDWPWPCDTAKLIYPSEEL